MKRSFALLAALLAVACTRRAEPLRPSGRAVLDKPVVLATLAADAGRPPEASAGGLGLHPAGPAVVPEFFFSDLGGGVAWTVEEEGKARVVHNGRASREYDAVGKIALSPDGRRCAFGALRDGRWRMVVDGQEGAPFDAAQDPVFSLDGAHLAYAAMLGERWHVVVDGRSNAGTPGRYGRMAFSGDSGRVAVLEEREGGGPGKLIVTDLRFERSSEVDGVSGIALNGAQTRIAAIVNGGEGAQVVSFDFGSAAPRGTGTGYDAVYGLAFGPDGASVTYRGVRGVTGYVVLDGREEPFAGDAVASQAVAPGGRVLGTLTASGPEVRFHPHFADAGKDEGPFDEAEGLVYSADGRSHAYAARRGASWFVVVNGREGPPLDRVVTPTFSPAGDRVVYRARNEGRRFVVVAGTDAKTIRQHPPYEQVFPVQLTADGRSVAYGVKDGRQLAWKVEGL